MMDHVTWPRWFFLKVPDAAIGLGLAVTSFIVTLWAITTIAAALERHRQNPQARLGFDLFLGVYLIIGDVFLYAVLGWITITDDAETDLWLAVWFAAIFLSAAAAFWAWAREKQGKP